MRFSNRDSPTDALVFGKRRRMIGAASPSHDCCQPRTGLTHEGNNATSTAHMIIAIDGPAASGKGTLARRIAKHYGLNYLDTGLIYRAVARDVLRAGKAPGDAAAAVTAARALDPSTLDDPSLKDRGIADNASIVAGHPEVRTVLLQFQRDFADQPPGAVMDGRDIGTVVCPKADAKLYISATPEVRAFRRHRELVQKGETVSLERVLEVILKRDARDSERAAAPMRPAEDADLLDTSNLSIVAAFDAAVGLIKRKIGQ
jgi:CMP/dCMP kinase